MKRIILLFLMSPILLCHGQGGIWTWVKGTSGTGNPGSIGTMGVTSSADYPDGRYQAGNWIDLNGNFWFFGGVDDSQAERNDLWKYNPMTNTWTWVNGPTTPQGAGNYGTMGVASPSNQPGARGWGMVTWTDHQGRLWLHGGYGYDITGLAGDMDDMWMYDIATNQWTWMKGSSNSLGTAPVYGNLQSASPANTPGGRAECNTAWVKSDGTLWTFGGQGLDPNLASTIDYNDMWKFDIATNNWTWMSGSAGSGNTGNYGTQGVETPSNLPPARGTYTRWIDPNDNFYIFGGVDSSFTSCFNDAWKYNTSNNEWTWESGSTQTNDGGLYPAYCQTSTTALPPARAENRTAQSLGCSDVFWTFGGFYAPTSDAYSDLWSFDTRTNNWTLVSGSTMLNFTGNYGNINVANTSNLPPSKLGECLWVDGAGTLWMWGGMDNLGNKYNDMWKFVPDTACLHTSLVIVPVVQNTDSIICPGDTSRLFINGHLVSVTPSATATILPDSQHIIFYPPVTTPYTVVASGLCGAVDTLHYTINISNFIPVAVSRSICPGDTIIYRGHVISSTGIYRDTVNSPRGCDTVEILTVNSNAFLPVSATVHLCPGGSTTFHGMVISTAGTYIDTLPSPGVGCDSIVTLTVTFAPITSSQNLTICSGDTINIRGHSISAAGIYTDTLIAAGGCDSLAILTVGVAPRPVAGFSIQPVGDTLSLGRITVTNTSSNADSALWLLNNQVAALIKDSILPIDSGGNYCIRLIAISPGGCRDSSQQCIYVFGNAFIMPNAFTPNGDGKNDLFYPVFINQNTNAVVGFSIYNRWGQLVYNDPTRGWDGNYKGEAQPGGVYTYYVSVNLPDESHPGQMKVVRKEGSFALMR